jgi:hypothetical protein
MPPKARRIFDQNRAGLEHTITFFLQKIKKRLGTGKYSYYRNKFIQNPMA